MSLRLFASCSKFVYYLKFTFRTLFSYSFVYYHVVSKFAFERTAFTFRAVVKKNVQSHPRKKTDIKLQSSKTSTNSGRYEFSEEQPHPARVARSDASFL